MIRKNLIVSAIVAWVVGLIAFIFPFLTTSGGVAAYFVRDRIDLNALSLMTRITFSESAKEMLLSDAPINGFLWVAMVAGIFGVLMSIESKFHWAKANEEHRPIIAIVSGVVGVFCLLRFQGAYSGLGDIWTNDWLLLKCGWGRNVAVLCYIVATLCMLGACVVQEEGAIYAKILSVVARMQAPTPSSTSAPKVGTQQVQTKMETLKSRFLNGELTAEEYEREKKLVEDIRDELSATGAVEAAPETVQSQAKEGQLQADGTKACFSGLRTGCMQVVCPNCSQTQASWRKECYNCGIKFVFDGEE